MQNMIWVNQISCYLHEALTFVSDFRLSDYNKTTEVTKSEIYIWPY